MKIVIVDGYKYIDYFGKLIPVFDEEGNHEKVPH